MTGYRSSFFRHDCNQRGCYIEQLPDWGDLIDCFPRKIRPTDIDGMVEINGQFLFLEEKSAGKAPDAGQSQALYELSKLPPVTTVFFRPGAASDLEVLTYGGLRQGQGWQPSTREEFHARIRRWAIHADSLRRKRGA